MISYFISLLNLHHDGANNFLTSLVVASHYDFGEDVIVFDSKMYRANRTVKSSSCHFDAFESRNFPPLADFNINVFNVFKERMWIKGTGNLDIHRKLCPDVAVVRMFPSISLTTVTSLMNPEIKGVVLMSFGSGNMPFGRKDILEVFKTASDRGCLILNISQCARGGVKAIYRTGFLLQQYGIFPGLDMTVEALYQVALYQFEGRLVLGQEERDDGHESKR